MWSIFVQALGVAALLTAISIFQVNNRKGMLLLGMAAGLLWSAHFFFLGAVTGAAMNLLGVTRAYVFYKVEPNKHNRWILYTFIVLIILLTILTWQGIVSLLPLLGSTISIIAYWQIKTKHIRRIAFATSPPWLAYNLVVGSYPGIIVEILKMSSNLFGQYRFDFKKSSLQKTSGL